MISTIIKTFMLKLKKENYRVPLGCTTPLSTLGYIKAAIELSQQIGKGDIKPIKKIYIAYGSGGTLAGLLIGLALMKSSIEVVAVQTVDSVIANQRRLRQLVAKSLCFLDSQRSFLPEVMNRLEIIEGGYLGKGYSDITLKAKQAIEKLSSQGLELEPIQTGKVMAALLDDLSGSASGSLLFWNTHHQEAMEEGDNYLA